MAQPPREPSAEAPRGPDRAPAGALDAQAPRAQRRIGELLAGLDTERLPGGYRLAGIDLDQGIALALEGPGGALFVELDQAPGKGFARSRNFRITYQWGGPSRTLTGPAEAALRRVVAWIVDHDRATPEELAAPVPGSRPVRRVRVERLLGTSPNALTDYHINPYVGCTVGCVYCNAQFRAHDVRRLDGRDDRPWGRWLDVKENAAEVLAAEVQRVRPGSVCFSPVVTDPYVQSERKYRITRGCLEVLRDAGFSAVVLTRTRGVLDDLPLLGQMCGAAVGVSIPSDDDELLRRLEPGALAYADRLAVLDAARTAGLTTFVVVQPAFPRDPEALVADIAARADVVSVDGLHEVERVGRFFAGVPLADPRALAAAFEARGVSTDLGAWCRHPAGRR